MISTTPSEEKEIIATMNASCPNVNVNYSNIRNSPNIDNSLNLPNSPNLPNESIHSIRSSPLNISSELKQQSIINVNSYIFFFFFVYILIDLIFVCLYS